MTNAPSLRRRVSARLRFWRLGDKRADAARHLGRHRAPRLGHAHRALGGAARVRRQPARRALSERLQSGDCLSRRRRRHRAGAVFDRHRAHRRLLRRQQPDGACPGARDHARCGRRHEPGGADLLVRPVVARAVAIGAGVDPAPVPQGDARRPDRTHRNRRRSDHPRAADDPAGGAPVHAGRRRPGDLRLALGGSAPRPADRRALHGARLVEPRGGAADRGVRRERPDRHQGGAVPGDRGESRRRPAGGARHCRRRSGQPTRRARQSPLQGDRLPAHDSAARLDRGRPRLARSGSAAPGGEFPHRLQPAACDYPDLLHRAGGAARRATAARRSAEGGCRRRPQSRSGGARDPGARARQRGARGAAHRRCRGADARRRPGGGALRTTASSRAR